MPINIYLETTEKPPSRPPPFLSSKTRTGLEQLELTRVLCCSNSFRVYRFTRRYTRDADTALTLYVSFSCVSRVSPPPSSFLSPTLPTTTKHIHTVRLGPGGYSPGLNFHGDFLQR